MGVRLKAQAFSRTPIIINKSKEISMRVTQHPILEFKEKPLVSFTFDGKKYEGFEGEPVATALYQAGVRVFGHTHEHGRPRGLYCNIGNCSSCLATVDGKPNVRICVEPLKAGMVVETQKGRGILK